MSIGNVIETETVEPYLGTETKKAELQPCVIPKPGSDCYKVIQWAMKDGSGNWGCWLLWVAGGPVMMDNWWPKTWEVLRTWVTDQ
eukprot:Skav227480  [mRNA]  locus=scaffold2491:543595:545096:+ [translate_table: standard]